MSIIDMSLDACIKSVEELGDGVTLTKFVTGGYMYRKDSSVKITDGKITEITGTIHRDPSEGPAWVVGGVKRWVVDGKVIKANDQWMINCAN